MLVVFTVLTMYVFVEEGARALWALAYENKRTQVNKAIRRMETTNSKRWATFEHKRPRKGKVRALLGLESIGTVPVRWRLKQPGAG